MIATNAGRKLLNSKRFWTQVIGILTLIVSAFIPGLEDNLSNIQEGIVAITMTIIGGYSIEDFGRQLRKNRTNEAPPEPVGERAGG